MCEEHLKLKKNSKSFKTTSEKDYEIHHSFYTYNYHNTVNQLYFIQNKIQKKKICCDLG